MAHDPHPDDRTSTDADADASDPGDDGHAPAGLGPPEEADATTQADMGLVGGTGAVEGTGTDEPYGTEGGPEESRDDGSGS